MEVRNFDLMKEIVDEIKVIISIVLVLNIVINKVEVDVVIIINVEVYD